MIVKPTWLNVGLDHLSRIETGEEPTNIEEGLSNVQLSTIRVADDHFADIIYFFTTRVASVRYTMEQKKEILVRVVGFSLIVVYFYKMGLDKILHKYFLEHERHTILVEAHGGVVRGHY